MNFSDDQLRSISNWEPLASARSPNVVEEIEESLSKIFGSRIYVKQVEFSKSGFSNYDSYFVSKDAMREGRNQGFFIYVSAMAPIAAVAEASVYYSPKVFSHSGIEPGQLLGEEFVSKFAEVLRIFLKNSGYHLMSREEALSPLPPDIKPYEYCVGLKPWDRVFHVLFANTD